MRKRWTTAVVALLVGSAAVIAAVIAPASSAAASHTHSTKWLLRHLVVAHTGHPGYGRAAFGSGWLSVGHGCDVRDYVLYRDAARKPSIGSDCSMTAGKWVSPYDGVSTTNSTAEQIDHVVPLEQAWASGAWAWSATTRVAYANDIGTKFDLVATSAHANESKGDRDPSQWLPSRHSYVCTYEKNYVGVLWRWSLAINPSLKSFLKVGLRGCGWPNVTEPRRPTITLSSPSPTPSPIPTPTPTPTATHSSPPVSHSCTRTSSGSCIRAGEFCPQADYGQSGYDAAGDTLVCTGDRTHPRWS